MSVVCDKRGFHIFWSGRCEFCGALDETEDNKANMPTDPRCPGCGQMPHKGDCLDVLNAAEWKASRETAEYLLRTNPDPVTLLIYFRDKCEAQQAVNRFGQRIVERLLAHAFECGRVMPEDELYADAERFIQSQP